MNTPARASKATACPPRGGDRASGAGINAPSVKVRVLPIAGEIGWVNDSPALHASIAPMQSTAFVKRGLQVQVRARGTND